MWTDNRGIYHTVALPDPTTLMSDVFRASLDRLVADERAAVAEMIESEENRFYEEPRELLEGTADDGGYVEAVPPTGLMTGTVATTGELQVAIQSIDRRWRLDALMALDDYIS